MKHSKKTVIPIYTVLILSMTNSNLQMKKSFLIICLTIISITISAQTRQDTIGRIEQIFSRCKAENPGCQLSISQNGQLFFSKAWGLADLERNVALTTNSIIEAGSVSKQFTAAAILLLAQQQKLSLNDDVRKYIPELPDYGKTIRIKHLIHHTSGLKDWGEIAKIAGCPRTTKTYNNADALNIVCQQNNLNNNPGDEMLYSNSNYNLLAIIVERVSGLSLSDFTSKYIFVPANMKNTSWRDNYKRIVPNRALAYKIRDNNYETSMPNENVYGNGGLLTTSEDLIKWNEFYLKGKLGGLSLLDEQITPDTLNNGEINYYAAGLFVQDCNGLHCIRHDGATAGYRCCLVQYPQINLSISFLSNTAEFGPRAVVKEIEDIFITNSKKQNNNSERKQILADNYDCFTGWYKNEKSGDGMFFQGTKNELNVFGDTPLKQTNKNEFIAGDIIYSFQDTNYLKVITPNNFNAGTTDTFNYFKVPTKSIDSNIHQYIGDYYSKNAQASYSILLNDSNKLMLIQKPNQFLKLIPTYTDGYYIDGIDDILYFTRNKNNEIEKMFISAQRARNIEFIKIK
jgi:CubicO group peptidase (beta-lactamase class C family)